MTPQSLLLVADELSALQGPGAPLQARLRRSISTSYYAAFHAALEVIASQAAGVTGDADAREAVRRATGHNDFTQAARAIIQASNPPNQPARNRARSALAYRLRQAGWSPYMTDLITLKEQRHLADYDLSARVYLADAKTAHAQAQRLCAFLVGHTTGAEGMAFFVLTNTN